MNGKDASNREIWEQRYSRGEAVNRYPHEPVVSFVMRHFARSERSGVHILDYGCGGGNHCAFLAREGFNFYGIDYSFSAVTHARKTVKDWWGMASEGRLLCADFKCLPFKDNFFNAVIDRQSLDQNMAAELPELVAEIRRVLKPGGKYFGMNFSDKHPALSFGTDLGNGDYGAFSGGPLKNIGKRHFFGAEEIKILFTDFVIEDIRVLSIRSILDQSQGSEEYMVIAGKPMPGQR